MFDKEARKLLLGATLAVFPLLLCGCSHDPHLSFLDPQGPVAEIQRRHFLEMLAVLSIFVALPIFVLIPWFAWRYRYGARSSRYTPKWKYFGPLEIAAWSGPFVIVTFLGVLVWHSSHALDPYKPLVSTQTALRIQVIGYDWKWLFIYPDQGVASVGMLALPAGRPVAMQLTSATVMQSLQIPSLGSQIYAMGGMVTRLNLQADEPGEFMGENTMYNGEGFHQQQFRAIAMTPDDFNAWVSKARSSRHCLDKAALRALSRRTTRGELIHALGSGKHREESISFSGASARLFPAVVRATMTGTAVDPQAPVHATAPRTPPKTETLLGKREP
ncbi:MAG: cytochrome ubiquinol oxidase subunit II [Rhodanobacter sp.]